MSEIPDDIMLVASALDYMRGGPSSIDIARAILAERNRCLSILKSIEPMNPSEAHLIEIIVRRMRGDE